MAVLLVLAGLGLLVGGAELLVRGASRLANFAGVSPLVIGLTVVAFGTSAPELAVSVKAGLSHQPEIALGNVVGSNIFNILLILGVAALVTPLAVDRRLVRVHVPVMIGVSVLAWVLALNGRIGRAEGGVLFAGIVVYTVIMAARREKTDMDSLPAQASRTASHWKSVARAGMAAAAGLALLVLGARWLVGGAASLARDLGVSELVIGLTLVAAGTSLPEAATSIVASIHGERDIAVGNIVGSNIFNILAVLGAAAAVSDGGIPIAPGALSLDIPLMVAVAVICLPVFFTGGEIARWEGAVFLACYGAYIAYLILRATGSGGVDELAGTVRWVLIPLTLLLVLVSLVRARGTAR